MVINDFSILMSDNQQGAWFSYLSTFTAIYHIKQWTCSIIWYCMVSHSIPYNRRCCLWAIYKCYGSSTRRQWFRKHIMVVERSFSDLKRRWLWKWLRSLYLRSDNSATKVIAACYCLHNISIDLKDIKETNNVNDNVNLHVNTSAEKKDTTTVQ